jgi:hypothetical protein
MLKALEVIEEISKTLGSGIHRCLDTSVILVSFMGLKMSWSDTSGGIHDLLA